MIRMTVTVRGMACGMCEAHVNDAIRNRFKVKKVASSRGAGRTVILSEEPIDREAVCRVIREAGYTPGEMRVETVEKKKISLFKRK